MRFSAAALRGLVPVLLAACATAQPLLDRADEALVRVVVATAAGRSYGSGFFVEERYVVTNHHVVQEALSPLSSARLFVIPHGAETEAPVDIVLHDARSDLAVLHYTGRASHAPLPLAATTPNPLARVFAMGYPVAVSDVAIGPTPSSTGLGFLSNDPYDGQLGAGSVRVLQHSADINPGNSGGPLIDDCGRVLGVNTSSGATEARGTVADGDGLELSDRESDTVVVTIPAQGIFYAVDVSELIPFLIELNADYTLAPACSGASSPQRERRSHLLTALFVANALALLLLAAHLSTRWRRARPTAAAGAVAPRWRREWGVAMMALPMLALAAVFSPGPRDDTDDRLARAYTHVLGRDWSASRTDENGWTDLHYAAFFNLPETARRLLDAGVPVDARLRADGELLTERLRSTLEFDVWRRNGQTPLHVAARYDSPDVMGVLVERGADLLAKTQEGDEAMHLAADSGTLRAVAALIDLGGDVSARNIDGEVPLLLAAFGGAGGTRAPLLSMLLDHGADVNARSTAGFTALHHAAMISRNQKVLDLLIDRGADVNSADEWGTTPLHEAIDWSEIGNVEHLLSLGADVDEAAVKAAAGSLRAYGAMQALLGHGANVTGVARWSEDTVLHEAAGATDGRVVQLLLELGVDVDARNYYGSTPLHEAARQGRPDNVRALLEGGASVDVRNHDGETPLHLAVQEEDWEVPGVPLVAALMDHGADVNARNGDGDMPLHLAIKDYRAYAAALLVRRGADFGARDGEGRTPLELARYSDDIRAILLGELGVVDELEAMLPDVYVSVGDMYNSDPDVTGSTLYAAADDARAVEWYRRAAARRHVEAQFRLGMMYRPGSRARSDPVTAYMWLGIAVLNGDVGGLAAENQRRVAEGMTAAQVAEAMYRTGVCVQSNYQDCR